MNESLFYEFLKEKNLTDEFNNFVKSKQSSMPNLSYSLNTMVGDADFWLDMNFIITKEDKEFLKEWSNTLNDDECIFSTGYESHEKDWDGEMIRRLFNDCDGYLEGDSYCMGTTYEVEPTNGDVGDDEEYIYERLTDDLRDRYEDFDEKLMKLFKKTSFYKEITEDN